MKLGIIVSSTRPNRQGGTIGTWVQKLAQEAGHEATLLDLAVIDLPFLDEPEIPMAGNYQNDHTRQWAETVKAYDGFVIVTAEYNHSYPAPLKNALDTLYAEWLHKPVGFVGYGVKGGVRAIEHLRGVVANLKMRVASNEASLMLFQQRDEQGNFVPKESDIKAVHDMLSEVAELGK